MGSASAAPGVRSGSWASSRRYETMLTTLVHPSAQQDALTAARHRAFIAPRLLGSVVALASFPAYLLVRGAPSAVELVVFAWLVAPILIAYFLSRTGRYESAHVLSSLALTGLVTAVAASPAASLHSPRSGSSSFRSRRRCRRRAAWSRSLRPSRSPPPVCWCSPANSTCCRRRPERTRRARYARRRVSGALCGRACARRRGAGAHQLLAPLCRGGPLPAPRPQHDRRYHAAWPRWRAAVRLARGAISVRLRHRRFARPRFIRSCPCRRSSRLSERAGRYRGAGREPVRRVSRTARWRRRRRRNLRLPQFVWIEMRCRPLEQANGRSRRSRPPRSRRRASRRDANARFRNRRLKRRAPKPSAPTPPRAVSSPR